MHIVEVGTDQTFRNLNLYSTHTQIIESSKHITAILFSFGIGPDLRISGFPECGTGLLDRASRTIPGGIF